MDVFKLILILIVTLLLIVTLFNIAFVANGPGEVLPLWGAFVFGGIALGFWMRGKQ